MFNLFFSLDWRLQMCSTKIYCLSKFSWILFFMSTRRQTCWREKFRLFSKAPSHLGLQLGWTVSPSGKGNCTAVSKGRVCSCCSQSDIWWMQLKHTHYKLCFWGNLHFSDLQPQPEEVLWFLAFWTPKIHCCGWYHTCKGMNLLFATCVRRLEWQRKEKFDKKQHEEQYCMLWDRWALQL